MKKILFFVVLIFSGSCFSLIPIESLLLGDFSYLYKGKKTDPLEYIFERKERVSKGGRLKKKVGLLQRFLRTGTKTKKLLSRKEKS